MFISLFLSFLVRINLKECLLVNNQWLVIWQTHQNFFPPNVIILIAILHTSCACDEPGIKKANALAVALKNSTYNYG